MPHKLKLDYITIYPRYLHSSKAPRDFIVYGSNDNVNWSPVLTETGASITATHQETGHTFSVDVHNTCYKYFGLVTRKVRSASTFVSISQLEFYGHRENDLVRLPDPTNVLKYPHIYGNFNEYAKRGYIVSDSAHNLPAKRFGWELFNGDSQWQAFSVNSQSAALQGYDITGDFNANTSAPLHTADSVNYYGHWVKIKMPHKIKVSQIHLKTFTGSTSAPDRVAFLVSNNDGSTWSTLLGNTALTVSDAERYLTPSDTTNYWQTFLFIVTSKNGNVNLSAQGLAYFGTGVDSIPIQIGGGNIDKVANFRVYDKFVGEDQALEIWDAQKDEFGRAKSSMTLYKGRLGLGTTEPEGRLAVLDEPNTFEPRWPPKPLLGYKTYIEGHGEFCVHRSGNESTGQYRGNSWWIFDDNQNVFNNTYHGERDVNDPINGNYSYFKGTNGEYTGGKSIGGISGDWTVLESPNPIKINDIIRMRVRSAGQATKGFIIAAANKFDGVWTKLTEQSNLVWQTGNVGESKTFHFENDTYYKYYAIIITQSPAQYGYPTLSDMMFSGIVQQGQSVLHDGQLTLTKNLNVPRIGPPLDADDTPRRDRLVVEYNTSTNPTFEGAVRDTSGRGNDGFMYGTAAYNSTSKDLYFDGNSDFIETDLGKEVFKNSSIHTTSLWVKMNHHDTDFQILFSLGNGEGNPTGNLKHINLYHSSNHGLRLSFTQHDYRLGDVAPVGNWVHVVYTYDGTTWQNSTTPTNVNIYINGVKVVISTVYQIGGGGGSALDLTTAQLALGAGSTNITDISRNYTDAALSQFKLYDTTLTAEEVKTLYDMGRCDEGHHVMNFSKTRVGIGLGDGEAPQGALDVRGDLYLNNNLVLGRYVGFSAYRSSATTAGNANPIVWDAIWTKSIEFNDLPNTTGFYRIPYTGKYLFTFYCITGSSMNMELFKNSSASTSGRTFTKHVPYDDKGTGQGSWMQLNGNGIEDFAAGEYVHVTTSTSFYGEPSNPHNGFSLTFLGA
jgi:hypothetical protein